MHNNYRKSEATACKGIYIGYDGAPDDTSCTVVNIVRMVKKREPKPESELNGQVNMLAIDKEE